MECVPPAHPSRVRRHARPDPDIIEGHQRAIVRRDELLAAGLDPGDFLVLWQEETERIRREREEVDPPCTTRN